MKSASRGQAQARAPEKPKPAAKDADLREASTGAQARGKSRSGPQDVDLLAVSVKTQGAGKAESGPQGEDFRDVRVKSDYQGAVARAILLAVGHLCGHSRPPVAPRRVVNFLKGNQFPRPQEREGAWAECFGLLQNHERSWLDEALESLLERGFLELGEGSSGREGGVRLSPQGKSALRGRQAIPAGALPERPLLGAHPEAEERLRLARQELAWSEGRATYGIFPNSVLAQIASRKPKTLSELAEIPGLGEARIRKYGRKILEALGEKD